MRQSGYNSVAVCLCITCSGSRQSFSLALLSWIFIVVSLLLGLLVSTIARTQVEAMLFSGMVLMMPTVLLSGMIFPIENMPLPLQLISNVIPARWYIVGIKKS